MIENLPANAGDIVWSLVWDDATHYGATKPMSHNFWAWALEPSSHSYGNLNTVEHVLQQENPPQWEGLTQQPESSNPLATIREKPTNQLRPNTAKNN